MLAKGANLIRMFQKAFWQGAKSIDMCFKHLQQIMNIKSMLYDVLGGRVARCWSVWLVIPFSKGAYER